MARKLLPVLSALLLVAGFGAFAAAPALAASNAAEILTYSLPGETGPATIVSNNSTDGTVGVTVPFATNLTTLVATFTASENITSIKVGADNQTSGVTANDFSSSVTYVVTAEDTLVTKSWVVTVTRAPASTTAEILTYSLPGQTGPATITSVTGTIGVTVPFATNLTTLVASFTTSPNTSNVTVGGVPQSSGITPNNFSANVTYVVRAEDTSVTKSWVVTVTRPPASTAAEILTYSLPGQTGPATITSATGTIGVTVPFGTNLASLVAGFTTSPNTSNVTVGGVPQSSGITPNNFSANVTYVVRAEDTLVTKNWIVSVATTPPPTGPGLSNLTISAGTLTPAFSANITSYTAGVANAVSSVTVTPEVSDNTTTIRVNGATVASGSASPPISLIVGSGNVITIDVTSQNVTGTPPYTVIVNRAALAMAISSVSPTSGPTTGGTSITITGTGFTGAAAVTIGGTAAVFSTPDDAHIVATTPPGAAGARDVTVTRPGSSATRPGGFTYVAPPPAGGDGGGGGFAGGGGGGVPASPGETNLGAFTNSEGVFNLAGVAVSQDGKVRMAFGRGVLARDRNGNALKSVSILPLADPPAPPADSRLIGLVYELGPAGAVFRPAITLTVSYDPSKLPAGFEEKDLVLATWDATAGKWIELPTSNDPLMLTVTVSIDHFSVYGIIAHARPASFSVSGLSIVPGAVDIGQPVGISVTVRNDGNLGGSYRVALLVSGALESTRDLHLSGGGTETVTFSVSRSATGAYAVDLNGLTGSFTVRPPVVAGVAAFETRDLSVSPTSIRAGDRVTVSFTVTNTGRARGTYHAALKVRGSVTETVATEAKDVPLEPGASQTVTFVIANTTPGTYGIEVDRLFGAFEVKPAEAGGQSVLGRWLIPGIALAAAAAMLAGFSLARRRRRVAGGPRPGG